MATYRKSPLAKEDLYFDTDGNSSDVVIEKSDGTFRVGKRINATHIPITTTARANPTASGAAMSSTNVDAAIIELGDELALLGAPDGTTLLNTAGSLAVKDASITGGAAGAGVKLAAATITVDNMAANSVDSDQYVDGSIETIHLADGNTVTGDKIADTTIDSEHYVLLSIDNEHLAEGTIEQSKMADAYSHYPKFAGVHTSTPASVSEALNIAGVLPTDVVIAQVNASTVANIHVRLAVPTTNNITFHWADLTGAKDPGIQSTSYVVFRAAGA